MNDDVIRERTTRSAKSKRFENVLRAARVPGLLPKLKEIDFSAMADLAPWVAVIHPDAVHKTLRFTMLGAGITETQGQSLLGIDYLDLFEPVYKGDAYDSAFVMLSKPCGLWQIMPMSFADGTESDVEYTGFPVFDEEHSRGVIMSFITDASKKLRKIKLVRHASEWAWIEMRSSPVAL